jgi:hypothetical protein
VEFSQSEGFYMMGLRFAGSKIMDGLKRGKAGSRSKPVPVIRHQQCVVYPLAHSASYCVL